ncbi:hypothetical protein SDC9_135258 [bioreactor metagenome]|uniref:Uncharacterized protein n=1 Tax=bioreactor metagenome TaxID=1076179 RepID=A0A645DFV8_9ZZZZ
MQGHLDALITVLVMHEVDDIQGIDIELGQPAAHCLKPLLHLIIVKILTCDRSKPRANLLSTLFIPSPIDCVQQGLCKIHAGTEELHLLADPHCGNTAGDTVVITVVTAHQIVVLILNGGRFDGETGAIAFEGFGKAPAPQNRKVRLRCRTEIGQAMQEAVTHLGHHVSSVVSYSSD